MVFPCFLSSQEDKTARQQEARAIEKLAEEALEEGDVDLQLDASGAFRGDFRWLSWIFKIFLEIFLDLQAFFPQFLSVFR